MAVSAELAEIGPFFLKILYAILCAVGYLGFHSGGHAKGASGAGVPSLGELPMSHDAGLKHVLVGIHHTQWTPPPKDRRPPICLRFCSALLLIATALFVSPARAVNPSISGSLTVPFLFSPDDPNSPGNTSFWYWSGGISGGLSLSVPSVLEITTSVLGNLDWSKPNN